LGFFRKGEVKLIPYMGNNRGLKMQTFLIFWQIMVQNLKDQKPWQLF